MLNRRVYYISGFDPRGSRFYHRLFREESKKSEQLSGATITTGKRKVLDDLITHWQVDAVWDKQSYTTDYRFMTWDDVMKQYWVSNIWMLILKSIPMYVQHIKIRLFPKFKKAGNGPYICSIYPLVYSLISLLLTALVASAAFAAIYWLSGQILLGVLSSVLLSYIFIRYAMRLGEIMNVWWILQTYYFISQWIERPLPDLDEKISAFAEKIIKDQEDSPVDEVVIVGHCVGAMVTVSVMSKLLSLQHESLNNKLSVITLGQCIPYISYAAPAKHFRQSLEVFANNQYYPWFDMGARADPLCFQLINPAMAEGITLRDENIPYRVLVRPYKMFSAEKYKAIQRNKLRIHFQYLMAADIKTDFDYFEMVTGHLGALQKYKT